MLCSNSKFILGNSRSFYNCVQFTLYNMCDTDSQQQLGQMVDSYNNTADNHQPGAAHDMKDAMQGFIESTCFQSQTSENETSGGDSAKN
jgi:hypothetical protein